MIQNHVSNSGNLGLLKEKISMRTEINREKKNATQAASKSRDGFFFTLKMFVGAVR